MQDFTPARLYVMAHIQAERVVDAVRTRITLELGAGNALAISRSTVSGLYSIAEYTLSSFPFAHRTLVQGVNREQAVAELLNYLPLKIRNGHDILEYFLVQFDDQGNLLSYEGSPSMAVPAAFSNLPEIYPGQGIRYYTEADFEVHA